MMRNDLAMRILDVSDDIVYIADVETYEVLFVNEAACKTVKLNESQCLGDKCYKVFQNLDAPCDFCTNHKLSYDKFYCWHRYNQFLDTYWDLRDILLDVDGRKVRLEMARDVSAEVREKETLRKQLSVEETLVRCIHTLSQSMDINISIKKLLEIICDYYDADRAYIFEIDYAQDKVNNTYEWCKPGIEPQIDSLQSIPVNVIDRWLDYFHEHGEFFITSVGKTVDKGTMEYEILVRQNIDSLVAAPLIEDGTIVGFIGVDNPGLNVENTSLLKSVTYFIQDDMAKKQMLQDLEQMSYRDSLTTIGNRNKYIADMKELMENPPESLGVAFLDINGLKEINDTYGHNQGDVVICKTAFALKTIFERGIYRVGGDEFVCLCPGETKEKFQNKVRKLRDLIEQASISISLGCRWENGNVDVAKAISMADELMYKDKQLYYRSRNKCGGRDLPE